MSFLDNLKDKLNQKPSEEGDSKTISEESVQTVSPLLSDDEIMKLTNDVRPEVDLSDIITQLKPEETIKQIDTKKEQQKQKELEDKVRQDSKKQVVNSLKKQYSEMSQGLKVLLTNLFLAICLISSIALVYYKLVPELRQLQVVKTDTIKITSDEKIVTANLKLLEESKKDAFEYRKLNDLLEQAIPTTDKYEDNIIVILNLLKESITDYSKQQKLLKALSIKPNVDIKDIKYFQLDTETLLGIEYNISVDWFEKYEYVKNFLTSVEDRLRIFHIQNIAIAKVLNRETKKPEYSVSILMYSYYKVPKLDEAWVKLEYVNVDHPFK